MSSEEFTPFYKDKTVLIILLIFLVIRLIPSILIPPGFDESYYGIYARFLSFGYFDHPPFTALTAGIGEWLFGGAHQFTLRFGALLLFIPTSILMYKISEMLFGGKAGIYSLILFNTAPYFLIGMGAFVIPDNSLGFFWLLFIYSLVKLKKTDNDKWILLSGLALGLGLMSKYHSILLFPGYVLMMILYKDNRKYLKSPYFYLSFIISFLVFLPNILWNYEHNWISYVYQFGKGAENNPFSLTLFLQGIFVQAGYLLPWNFILIIAALIHFTRKKYKEFNWLVLFAALPILIFTYIGASRQILPHWPMPGYLIGIILSGLYLEKINSKLRNSIFVSSSIVIIAVISVLSIHSQTGFISGLEKKQDLTLDGQGWKQVINYIQTNDSLKNKFIFTQKWFTAGELAYFSEGKSTVTMLNEEAAHSFSNWVPLDNLYGKDGIFISTDRYPAEPEEIYKNYFAGYEHIKEIKTYRGSSEAQVFNLWLCKNLDTAFKYPY